MCMPVHIVIEGRGLSYAMHALIGGISAKGNVTDCSLTHLEQLELNAAVSAYVSQRQLVEPRQEQLHVRQEGFQGCDVVVA